MNTLDKDIEGKVIRIRKDQMKEEWQDDEKRAFYVVGGFGAHGFTGGTALFGIFLYDGEEARMDGLQVDVREGVVADSLEEYEGPIDDSVHEKV